MKVKVIGSGCMWTKYNSACYLIDDDIMVDFPNGAAKYLYRLGIDINSINNILVTHFHGDHYFDIPVCLLYRVKNNENSLNIYSSREGKRKIKKLYKLAFPHSSKEVFKSGVCKFNFDSNFILNDYTVTRLLVDHGNLKPAHGYIFEKDDIKVGFTGDTVICDNVKYMASVCKYLFCDCSGIEGNSSHMGIDNLKELSSKYKDCKFVVSHMLDKTREELKKLKIKNVIIPEDGMEIDIKYIFIYSNT